MLRLILKSMRPRQWTKNVFVFAALVFDQKLLAPRYLAATVAGFAIFCLLSSAVYLVNDLADAEKDRQHPTKRNRPIPSGQLSRRAAWTSATALVLACLPLAFALGWQFGLVALGYLVENLLYSFWLKHVVIVDVLMIALGFVLRVVGGVTLVDVQRFSPWMYMCMTLLALFIGFGKRRQELVLMGEDNHGTRASLQEYTVNLLDHMIGVVTATTVVAYSLYTFSASGLPVNDAMMLTIPFVLYGIFRYLYLIHVRGDGGAPDELLLRDRPLQITVVLWGLTVFLIMYAFDFPLRP